MIKIVMYIISYLFDLIDGGAETGDTFLENTWNIWFGFEGIALSMFSY